MNGWADGEPAWWLNLQAHPVASVDLADGSRSVRAARRRETNEHACGLCGAMWVTTSTRMRP